LGFIKGKSDFSSAFEITPIPEVEMAAIFRNEAFTNKLQRFIDRVAIFLKSPQQFGLGKLNDFIRKLTTSCDTFITNFHDVSHIEDEV